MFSQASADACSIGAAGRCDLAIGDGDVTAIATLTATNASPVIAAGSCDFAAGDGDIIAVSLETSANARPIIAAGSCDLSAGDGDVFAVCKEASANARCANAAGSCDLAAGDGDIIATSILVPADACCGFTAGGDQLAVFIFIRNGQFTLITITVLFQTGMIPTTLKGICAIQLDIYVALSVCRNSSTACIDVYIRNRHVGSHIFSRIDRDCVACLYRALPLRNHRSLIRHSRAAALRYRLSGIVCVYRNAAIFQIPVGGIGCHGQAYAHDQCDHACCQLFSLHLVSSLFSFFISTLSPAMKIHSAWQVL